MKVFNMEGKNGNKVPNQFIITEEGRGANGNFLKRDVFQSYESAIIERTIWQDKTDTKLDAKYWDYSTTTSKYRNIFLGEDTKTIKAKIKSGEYILTNLN